MRISGLLRECLSVELLLLWLLQGTVSGFVFASSTGVSGLNYQNSLLSSHIFPFALVSLSIPWTTSGEGYSVTSKPKSKSKTRKVGNTTSTTTPSPKKRRKGKNLPQKQTTANNALLANIDFLTQLTNSKQEKNAEMDPLKCFPKALCGLSAESAAITRRRKNGLISDYIRLMKAVALNPSVMDKTLKKLKKQENDNLQDDVRESTESEEDRDDGDDEEDEEGDDDDAEQRGQPALNKRTNTYGYGYESSLSSKQDPKYDNDGLPKKRTKRKEFIPKNSDEFTKQYLQEKAHVERLIEDGFFHEETESQNWWAYENERDPHLEELVGDAGNDLDSRSRESYYTFGGKRKPDPPTPPHRPEQPQQPIAPFDPEMMMRPLDPPPRPQAPSAPVVRIPESSNYGTTGTIAAVGNFLRNVLGFGSKSFSNDPFFQGFQRSLPDGTPTVVTVDKTKEILTTAIEIGETLRSPNQCNSLFNGCKYQYIELLHVIDDIRQSLAQRGKDSFYSSQFYSGVEEENDSGVRADDTYSSYGYNSSLSETSQAETLSPDYSSALSAVTGKNRRKKPKKKSSSPSYRDGKMSSMSSETSIEIGSDEPTMYGSGQQNFDFHQYNRHGHGPHHHHNQPSRYNNHQQSGGYQQSYQFEDIRQPKTIWGSILSWFGFRR